MEKILQCSAALLILAVHGVTAFPSGPPPSSCIPLFPYHDEEKQTGVPPFRLVFSSDVYAPGQSITVTVESTEGGRTFRGFQVTAHRVSSSGNAEEFIGVFSTSDNSSQTMACLGQPQKMLAHKDASNRTSVSATWTAPDVNVGDLQFFLTVVETKPLFWHKIPASLAAASATDLVVPQSQVPGLTVSPSLSPDWTECGVTKGCWLVPISNSSNCSGHDCQAAVSFRKQGDVFLLELAVKGHDYYIAVGFSDDEIMSDDQTVVCTANTGHESVQLGYNPSDYSMRQFSDGLSNAAVRQVDGSIYCSFTRRAALTSLKLDGTPREFDLNNQYYLFLAWGPIYQGTDVIWKHTDAPAISSTKVDLAAFTSPAATTPTPSAASRPQAVVGSLLVFFFALAAAAVLTM